MPRDRSLVLELLRDHDCTGSANDLEGLIDRVAALEKSMTDLFTWRRRWWRRRHIVGSDSDLDNLYQSPW